MAWRRFAQRATLTEMRKARAVLLPALVGLVAGCGASNSGGTDDPRDAGALADAPPEDATGVTQDASTRDAAPEDASSDEAPMLDASIQEAAADATQGEEARAEAGSTSGPILSAYKDTGVSMNWNTNVISTSISGSMASLAADLGQAGATTITLAFATGECGSENWAGVAGDVMASANVPLLAQAGVRYIVSTGGADGSFTCASDSGMTTFAHRWASAGLVGFDFDIEAGQSRAVIGDLVQRIQALHATTPGLRFSLTLGTLANNNGASSAQSLGSSAPDSFNVYGDDAMSAVQASLGFTPGTPSTWPSYLTVNLMTMDYGSAGDGVCVVASGHCQMGQSALQAAYNLRDHWGVPFANIEITPMIGGNDMTDEHFTLPDVDTVATFVLAQGLAGVHYWSYDRDTDCPMGAASSTCNSMGSGYAGPRGYLSRWLADGLR